MNDADLVFLDPDNGLGSNSTKHATFDEVGRLRKLGRAVTFITFPGRSKPHAALIQGLHDRLIREVGATKIITLRINISVPRTPAAQSFVQRQRWFTIIDPDETLVARALSFAKALDPIPRIRVHVDSAP